MSEGLEEERGRSWGRQEQGASSTFMNGPECQARRADGAHSPSLGSGGGRTDTSSRTSALQ